MAYKVSPKGQVVIAREIREKLGVKPGWIAVQRLVGDHVEIYFLPPPHRRSLRGVLKNRVQARVPPDRWEEAREKAWQEASRE